MEIDILSQDERWMREALYAADEAFNNDEVPVGAVVVRGDEVVDLGVDTSDDEFIEALKREAISHASLDDGRFIIRGQVDRITSRVWQIAEQTGTSIRSLAPSRNSLEDIFLQAVQEQPDGR